MSHVARMEIELEDLTTKIQKLDAFISSEAFKSIMPHKQELLIVQRCAMISYHFALSCRLQDERNPVVAPEQPQVAE